MYVLEKDQKSMGRVESVEKGGGTLSNRHYRKVAWVDQEQY